MAKAIMLQGTGSDVGKSLMVAGLCRHFANRGLKVMPFKPQNMSNNAAVTADGGEIGRAQALQARAARVPLSVHMNPVLLKPQSEIGAQIVVQGRMRGSARAREYQSIKPTLLPDVLESYRILSKNADLVIVEGAGSASEINLRAGDIANMGFARAASVPVILVGDIDRGGVIAQILGTKAALDAADAALVRGFIVNKMRGDLTLFDDGMRLIAERTGWPAVGLVPWFADAERLPAEDALGLVRYRPSDGALRIAVPILPWISNFDDLDPLAAEPDVSILAVRRGEALPVADVVLLPGSKATLADLAAFRANGWDIDLAAHVRRGGAVLGLCGGYQMLGKRIEDPTGVEGPPGGADGLGHLDVVTVLGGEKTLVEVQGHLSTGDPPFHGYEMHVGTTTGADTGRPLLTFVNGRADGAVTSNGRVAGCYVHGLFASDAFRKSWLEHLGGRSTVTDHNASVEAALDALAAHVARHIDTERLLAVARADS